MWHQIQANKRKTFFVLFLMTVFFLVFGMAVGFFISEDVIFSLVIVLIILISYFIMIINSDKIALSSLGDSIYECTPDSGNMLYNVVSEMKIASGLAYMPKVYIWDTDILNAFACGTNEKQAKVVVTKGLLNKLNRSELQGVVAHEIAHIVNRDSLYIMYAGIFVCLVSMISRLFLHSSSRRSSSRSSSHPILLILLLVLIIISPLIAQLFYFSLSRKREYLADACAALYTRYPSGLASALTKISSEVSSQVGNNSIKMNEFKTNSNPLLNVSYIIPLTSNTKKDNLFSTHPSTQNRIDILLNMGSSLNRADFNAYNIAYMNVTKKHSIIHPGDIKTKEVAITNPGSIAVSGMPAFVSDNASSENKNKEDSKSVDKEIKKYRDTENMMWDLAGYITINCPCDTKLKVPQSFIGKIVTCPHCKKQHII